MKQPDCQPADDGRRQQQSLEQPPSSRRPSQQEETNDKSRPTASTPSRPDCERPARATPLRQPRPLRPNLRRQVMVASSHEVGACAPSMAAPIELAQILRPIGPPKRPAQLPARYATYGPHAGAPVGLDGQPAVSSKPNRYAWAQLQHWHPADQVAAGGGVRQRHFAPFSSAASRVLVVNPMQMVNLSEHTKSRLIKVIEAVKRFSEKWFSHVLLLLFLAVYACLGAYVFISFEAPTEQREKQAIIDLRASIVNESWANSQIYKEQPFVDRLLGQLESYEQLLNRACAAGMTSSSQENQWTFWGALFYSMTVFTTIGYGQLTPTTFAGRVATMVYAIFGIPILLMVLADLGKLLTRIIKFAFKKFRYLYNKLMRRKESLRTRQMISQNTNQYVGVARDTLARSSAYIQARARLPAALASRWRAKANDAKQVDAELAADGQHPNGLEGAEAPATVGADDAALAPAGQLSSDVIVTPANQTKPVSPPVGCQRKLPAEHQTHGSLQDQHRGQSPAKRKTSTGKRATASRMSVSRSSSSSVAADRTKSPLSTQVSNAESPALLAGEAEEAKTETISELDNSEPVMNSEFPNDEEADEEIDDDFDIPVSFALFLLVTYMMFGAVVFSIWEGWNFFDSLYFVFISMSTIGFGDLVPQHPKRMIGTFIYLLFGLALTSMCINVVQEKIHATFLRAKMQIGEKMGLDLEQIMADDYYDNSVAVDGDEDDFASVAMSHTNLSLGQLAQESFERTDGAQDSPGGPKSAGQQADAPTDPAGATVRPSKVKEISSRSKKRSVASLPGHHSGSLRRKPSKKVQRQPTPSADSAVPAAPTAAQPSQPVVQMASLQPIRAELEVERVSALSSVQLPSINQPINERRGTCEPLTGRGVQLSPSGRLFVARSQPPSSMVKSLSAERAPASDQSPLGAKVNSVVQGHSSAGQSRRSSVSTELNALDDLICALSQSPSERFRPLLGLPSSGRSSRCSSPNLNRRATSMTDRHSRLSGANSPLSLHSPNSPNSPQSPHSPHSPNSPISSARLSSPQKQRSLRVSRTNALTADTFTVPKAPD